MYGTVHVKTIHYNGFQCVNILLFISDLQFVPFCDQWRVNGDFGSDFIDAMACPSCPLNPLTIDQTSVAEQPDCSLKPQWIILLADWLFTPVVKWLGHASFGMYADLSIETRHSVLLKLIFRPIYYGFHHDGRCALPYLLCPLFRRTSSRRNYRLDAGHWQRITGKLRDRLHPAYDPFYPHFWPSLEVSQTIFIVKSATKKPLILTIARRKTRNRSFLLTA